MQVEREVRAAIRADARCYEVVIGYGARARYGPNQRELSDYPTNRTTMSFRVLFLRGGDCRNRAQYEPKAASTTR
jgi:hypothetical protein